MKSKYFITYLCVSMGLAGLILFFFGHQSNGTLSDQIQQAGMLGIGVFVIWGVIKLANSYMKQKELENL
jgi:succinate dehydrogenase/fumarate reductase cytochrome b subunit